MKRFSFNQFLLGAAVAVLGASLLLPARAQTADDDPATADANAQPQPQIGGLGGGGGFGGGGGGGNPQGHLESPLIQAINLAVIVSKDQDRITAYNPELGQWHVQPLESKKWGIATVIPVLSSDLAVVVVGDRAHAYSAQLGKWQTQELQDVLKGQIVFPQVSGRMASVMVGERVYAYSAVCGRWDELRVQAGNVNNVSMSEKYLSQINGDILSMFSAQTGTWSSIDWKRGKTINWRDKQKQD